MLKQLISECIYKMYVYEEHLKNFEGLELIGVLWSLLLCAGYVQVFWGLYKKGYGALNGILDP